MKLRYLPMNPWADVIKRIRGQMDMNQTEMGSELGVDQSMISKYETGTIEPPEEFLFNLLDRFFDDGLYYMLLGDQDEDKNQLRKIKEKHTA